MDASLESVFQAALKERFDMRDEDADEIAVLVAEKFSGNSEINDEALDPAERSVFYVLESKKLLSWRREEYDDASGERRRAFYWRVREDVLETAAKPSAKVQTPEEATYAQLPKDAWCSGESKGVPWPLIHTYKGLLENLQLRPTNANPRL